MQLPGTNIKAILTSTGHMQEPEQHTYWVRAAASGQGGICGKHVTSRSFALWHMEGHRGLFRHTTAWRDAAAACPMQQERGERQSYLSTKRHCAQLRPGTRPRRSMQASASAVPVPSLTVFPHHLHGMVPLSAAVCCGPMGLSYWTDPQATAKPPTTFTLHGSVPPQRRKVLQSLGPGAIAAFLWPDVTRVMTRHLDAWERQGRVELCSAVGTAPR